MPLTLAAVAPALWRLGWMVVGTTWGVGVLRTVLTAAEPRGGDASAERMDVPDRRAAQVHGAAAMLLLAMVVVMVGLLVRARAERATQRRAQLVLAVLVAQAAVGYAQYFSGVPVLLVGVHIAGATALWAVVLRFYLGLGPGRPGTAEVKASERQLVDA